MSVLPSPTARKGEVTVQPAYFTSSLYVDPLREDITRLAQAYAEHYARGAPAQPFALFKALWLAQGWPWMHFKIFDARSRDTFLDVTMRLFMERTAEKEPPLTRVVALFGLYTFFMTQPRPSAPLIQYRAHVQIPIDLYTSLLTLPETLTETDLLPLRLHAIHVLSRLVDAQLLQILPPAVHYPLNPRELPREVFVRDGTAEPGSTLASELISGKPAKKKGRKTKRERAKRAKEVLALLDKWLDQSAFTYPAESEAAASSSGAVASTTPATGEQPAADATTHVLITNAPIESRNDYRAQKLSLLDAVYPQGQRPPPAADFGTGAIERANAAVLARMRRIDQLAAEKGLEVGGEGGDRTGLERVERAVQELGKVGAAGRRGGILGLLEGSGVHAEGGGPGVGEDTHMEVDPPAQ